MSLRQDSHGMRKPRDEELLRALAAEIRARRNFAGLSQEELAFRADLNRTFIGKIELGSTQPSMTVLFHLAGALDVNVADLVSAIETRAKKERQTDTQPSP